MAAREILIVEDEESIRRGIRINLETEGFLVREHADAKSAYQDVRNMGSPDLGIFDIMLPGPQTGVGLCRQLRAEGFGFPVIFLSARSELSDKLLGFESGGDDYITKPFDLEELLARVEARLRPDQRRKNAVRIGAWTLDLEAGSATSDTNDESVRFSGRETQILRFLVERRGRPVSRDEILDRVWGEEAFPTNRTIDNYIVRFRRLFEPDPNVPTLFITRHGTGYELAREKETQ